MKTKKQIITLAALFLAALMVWLAWAGLRAHSNLITLDVRAMDVHDVVKKIEHQAWDKIYVDKNVQGKVTLHVRRMPLEDVLHLIADQAGSRSLVLYPLYSTRASFAQLEQSLRGEVDPATHGWTNLAGNFGGGPRGGMMMFAGGMGAPFGAMPDNPNRLVSLDIRVKDVAFATLAFNRFAQARVVPEDGTSKLVSLSLTKVPVDKAVARLATKADRKWKKVYVLRGGFGGGRGGPGGAQFARREGGRPGNGPARDGSNESTDDMKARREEAQQNRETLEQELRDALPADERQKLEQAQAQRDQQMKDLASLTPEQRRDRMGQIMGGPNAAGFDRMNRQRVLNSTPEQRAEMTRREKQMRQARAQSGAQPNGPRTR